MRVESPCSEITGEEKEPGGEALLDPPFSRKRAGQAEDHPRAREGDDRKRVPGSEARKRGDPNVERREVRIQTKQAVERWRTAALANEDRGAERTEQADGSHRLRVIRHRQGRSGQR